MPHSPEQIRRAARQHLETTMLMGVDFIPIRRIAAEPARLIEPEGPIEAMASAVSPFIPRSEEEIAAMTTPKARQAALDELKRQHDAGCPHCTTTTGHTQTVFGEGNPAADLMFIGEAPGAEEDRTGRPFVGRAGQKLDDIIRAMKLKREDVYIANVLKSRPPDNRTPLPNEVAGCGPYLVEQVRIIRPKVIVTLGGPATKLILGTDLGITRVRGMWGTYLAGSLEVPVMPTFHPAYLLRNYTPETRQKVWADMQAVMERLGLGSA